MIIFFIIISILAAICKKINIVEKRNIRRIIDFSEFFQFVNNLYILIFNIFCTFEKYLLIFK